MLMNNDPSRPCFAWKWCATLYRWWIDSISSRARLGEVWYIIDILRTPIEYDSRRLLFCCMFVTLKVQEVTKMFCDVKSTCSFFLCIWVKFGKIHPEDPSVFYRRAYCIRWHKPLKNLSCLMFPQVNGCISNPKKSCCCFDCGDICSSPTSCTVLLTTNEDLNTKTPAAQLKPTPNATINKDEGNNKLCKNDQIETNRAML